MKESKADQALAVGEYAMQAASAAKLDRVAGDLSLQLNRHSQPGGINGTDPGSVFVAQWQMKQQVLDIDNPQLLKLFLEGGTNTLEPRQRHSIQLQTSHCLKLNYEYRDY
jgi:hypothetical protein